MSGHPPSLLPRILVSLDHDTPGSSVLVLGLPSILLSQEHLGGGFFGVGLWFTG